VRPAVSGARVPTLRIGELAERAGLTPDAIRYYEKIGVMPEPERTPGGYRLYRESDVERLAFVGQAQTLGLTLEEIAEILLLVDEGMEPCAHVAERLRQRLGEVEGRMEELAALRRRLREALRQAEGAPRAEPCRCRIIERSSGQRRVWIRRPRRNRTSRP
jgi:DNA-binding transcriptional MerR regulator